MKRRPAPSTAAGSRALTFQVEAEAAEAEARAAAARARAIRARREAEAVTSEEADNQTRGPATEEAVTAVVDTRSVDADADGLAGQGAELWPVAPPARGRGLLIRPRLFLVASVLAVMVSLAAIGAGVEMMVLHKNAVLERQRVAEYAAAARKAVVTLTSLDYEHAKEGVQRILEISTGTFKDDFLKSAEDFTDTLRESKVISHGSVRASAVDLDSVTANSAVVLVASTSEVTNAAGVKQDPRKYRLIVTVTREGGQLKMSRVEFIQ
ncbi:hypothetical protein [Mycobacterium asiaticum]|uniref:Mammalian cell entry protein n=1 Tax=Mycobacterium asiaticum TaxID=1790 RepID=A0A1A3NAA1_MYCAS|nr:hypothetical protein [Mycobacterium asiaticum]OBK18721.1 hypothetical protein A5636_02295 [Mycobacterium asiaticum]